MKKTNKTKKYDYVVDLSKIKTLSDVYPCWAFTRHRAGLVLSDEELADICLEVMYETYPICCVPVTVNWVELETKKTPWYKRAWNWLTKPFRKNK